MTTSMSCAKRRVVRIADQHAVLQYVHGASHLPPHHDLAIFPFDCDSLRHCHGKLRWRSSHPQPPIETTSKRWRRTQWKMMGERQRLAKMRPEIAGAPIVAVQRMKSCCCNVAREMWLLDVIGCSFSLQMWPKIADGRQFWFKTTHFPFFKIRIVFPNPRLSFHP